MKRLLFVFLFALICTSTALAQNEFSVIADLDDDFATLDTVARPPQFKSIHMLGVKYSYDICKVGASPSIGEDYYHSPVNYSLLYTYYHPLWDQLFVFGIQTGVKYGRQGYTSPYEGFGEINKYVEIPLLSQFKIDFSIFRLLVDLGPYYTYRLDTDKEGGFDEFDIRNDYGVIGGAGLAIVLGPVELQLEGQYKYSLCSMYHTYKVSDQYWLFAYPRNIMISASLFFHLW
jgi:hypothetical protein